MLIMQGVACHLHFTDKRDLHEDFDEFDTGINLEVCIDDIDIKVQKILIKTFEL